MAFRSLSVVLASLTAFTSAAPAPNDINARLVLDSDYAPQKVICPSIALVRPASGVSSDEAAYVKARKVNADKGLAAWLKRQGKFSTASQPSVGFTGSGGGLRALLESAGVIQGLDIRDSNFNVSGLFQGLTYEAGLSGGAWFLSSFSGNNWPTVSNLAQTLWYDAFQNTPLLPATILASDEYPEIANDLTRKELAGFDNTLVDPYGRFLSYQLLKDPSGDGGDNIRLSTLTGYTNFTSHAVPYPIITALGVDNSYSGQCDPTLNATQYEFHPYEYGSWDKGVSAFARTQYMGSDITNGKPTVPGSCIQHYDNIGYIFGTSSDIFPGFCGVVPVSTSSNADLENVLESLVNLTKTPTFQDLFGIYPNPFKSYPRSTTVNARKELTMADGGLAGQNVPIWPFIQNNARSVDVLIASDNSADTSDNFPNGTELHQTYLNAKAAGLSRMPYIPDVPEFVSKGLNKRATFFGCESPKTMLIVYLPNVNYTYMSNQSTFKVQYSKAETMGMIANGNAIATQNGAAGWSFCLACGIKARDGLSKLPSGCTACLDKYCYKAPTN